MVEILHGNPAYEEYAEKELVTSEFNLLELAYALVRDYSLSKAIEVLRAVQAFVEIAVVSDEDYVKAAQLRLEARKTR